MELPFGKCEELPRAFWQARFYDFNVYRYGKKMEKLNYMHANPITRGLVKHPKEWPWSSWGFYHQKDAQIRMDVE
jgi:REP element-mobilizing transposase RayT